MVDGKLSAFIQSKIEAPDQFLIQQVRLFLHTKLTLVMQPIDYYIVDYFPVNINAKLDLRTLKSLVKCKTKQESIQIDHNFTKFRHYIEKDLN